MSVPRSEWSQEMIPLGEYLQNGETQNDGKVPYILMVDESNILHRVVVSKAMTDAAKRYGRSWRSLQEFGGIGNSHALRLLDREKRIWEEEKQKEERCCACMRMRTCACVIERAASSVEAATAAAMAAAATAQGSSEHGAGRKRNDEAKHRG